jgi:peptide/nickel transport system substrate-binding protein
MKKSFYLILITSLVMLIFLLGSLSYGAPAKTESPKAKGPISQEPQYGGTLTLLRTINPIAWDIAEWTWKHANDTGFYMDHLMIGDLQKGPRGAKKFDFQTEAWNPLQFCRPELLESWEVKKNPMQIIFHLRKGIMWQEKPGVMKARELVADDVVYSINRRKNSPKAPKLYLDFVGKMETPDKYTVIIHMAEWCLDWDYRIGWGYYDAIQAPEQEKAPGGANKWENATGTGPFMITEYKDGHSQTYTKNPNYWNSETIGGKKYKLPFVEKIYMPIIKDEQTQVSSFRSGKLDLLVVNWKYVDELKKSLPQLIWRKYPGTGNFSLALRMDRKPFNDIRVRRALNLAVNKQEIIDSFYKGNAELHTYPFPISFGEVYTPVNNLPASARELYTYNPEKAKKLLAEAGYPKGFTFKAQIYNTSQTLLDLAAMLVAYFAKVGVKLELDVMDYGQYLNMMLKKTHSEGYFLNTGQTNPIMGIKKNFMTGQQWNPHMMADPYLDKTWTDAIEDPKPTEKQVNATLKKLAVYAIEQAPAVILPTAISYIAWWPWVKNYYGETNVGAQNFGPISARIWIDQEMKKKMGY